MSILRVQQLLFSLVVNQSLSIIISLLSICYNQNGHKVLYRISGPDPTSNSAKEK